MILQLVFFLLNGPPSTHNSPIQADFELPVTHQEAMVGSSQCFLLDISEISIIVKENYPDYLSYLYSGSLITPNARKSGEKLVNTCTLGANNLC